MQGIHNRLDKNIIDLIKHLVQSAQVFGVNAYFVGGVVRDLILGLPIKDIDIVVEGNAIDFVKTLECATINSEHQDFGTIKATMAGQEIDFASTREDEYPKSGCLPIVKNIGCELKADILRRDFTLNSIAMNLENFSIVDYLDGVTDLKNRALKILHKKSFIDDPTRILRGLDFILRFELSLDAKTKKLQNEYLNSPNRDGLSLSRVDLTLKKLFQNNNPKKVYENIVRQKLYKIWTDTHPSLSLQEIEQAMVIFKASDSVYLKALQGFEYERCLGETSIEIYKFFNPYSKKELALYWAKYKDSKALEFQNKYKDVQVYTTGKDLLKMGFQEGKLVGEVLEALLERKLLNKMSKEQEQKWIHSHFSMRNT